MTKKKRILAFIVAFSLLFVMLSFAVFTAHNSDHDCIGEGCTICAQINMCKNLVASISVAVIVVYIAAVIYRRSRLVFRSTRRIVYTSPVSQKVRLLN